MRAFLPSAKRQVLEYPEATQCTAAPRGSKPSKASERSLFAPNAYRLPERQAREFEDHLVDAVSPCVKPLEWRKNLRRYARICFHEAAHAVRAVELGIDVHRVCINPDEDTGRVITRLNRCSCSPKERSIIDAKIALAGPYAEDMFHSIDRTGIWRATHDLMHARFTLEYGKDLAEPFSNSMQNCRTPIYRRNLQSFKNAYIEVRDRTLASCLVLPVRIRSKRDALGCLAELQQDTKRWMLLRRELLLEVAAALARLGAKEGRNGVDGRTATRCIGRVLRDHGS